MEQPVQQDSGDGKVGTHAYLVGGGVASLAAAVFLLRDGKLRGENIHLFDEAEVLGGSLDAGGDPERGYVLRGCRMFDDLAHTCTYDLLSAIPIPGSGQKSLEDEVRAFNLRHRYHSHCRLLGSGTKVDATSFGLSWGDRLTILRLFLTPEGFLEARRIQEYFRPSFFRSHFWLMWSTIFAFQPWHCAAEFKRYLLRYVQWVHALPTLAAVRRTPINQYEYLIIPITRWLQERGVQFHLHSCVTDLDIVPRHDGVTVERLWYTTGGDRCDIPVERGGLVFVTLGSMTADTRLGSMHSAARADFRESGGSWGLWETLADKRPELGRPRVFNGHVEQSRWLSFTLTLRDPTLVTRLERLTGNRAGTGGLVTITDSSWLLSISTLQHPQFLGQPAHVSVCWGYGLFPDRPGDYVRKPMLECSGEEILTELCHHFRFEESLPFIARTSTCIPCLMPYITSQFLPRARGDRPLVHPKGYTNLAFLGQYCEIPGDTVFTVEYSVRSAQIAVNSLLHLDKKVSPIYKGQWRPHVVWQALKTMLK